MDAQTSILTLYILGAPRLENASNAVEMDTRKALAMLAYLAVTGTSHSRESLATLFWPEYGQASSRGALRRTLSTLHKATQGSILEIDRERIRIRPGAPIWVDVLAFRQLITDAANPTPTSPASNLQHALQQAIDLYTGDFLQGFTLRDSPAFDDWQFFQTDSLRRELASALEKLALAYSHQMEDEAAILIVRRWLALDELQEAAQRWLMKLYAWTGQRNAALRQYRECVRVLEQELGVPPLPETTQLYQAVLENQLPPRPLIEKVVLPDSMTFSISPEGYPLTGREVELAQLQNIYWTGALQGALVIIEGEAGIGKTRLAEEIINTGRQAGAKVLTARCYADEAHLAYGPFLDGIQNIINQPGSLALLEKLPAHWLSEAARLAPALSKLRPDLPPPLPADGPGAQSRFFEAIRQFLMGVLADSQSSTLQSKPPGILFLDDLHWADNATLDLLIYIVRRLRGHALLVLLSWRSRAGFANERMLHLVTETIRSGYGYNISLERLAPSGVTQLAESATHPLPADFYTRLYRETEGLPLMVTAYLDAIKQHGLPESGSSWELPASVRNVLRSRLPSPEELSWQLLTTAAVIGQPFDFETLRQASGRSELETITGLETLLSQGLIQEHGESECPGETRFGFTHDRLLNLVYEEISLARLRLLHQRVAEALGSGYNRREGSYLATRIAQHYRTAGQDSQAAEYFQQAGNYARQLFANQEALAHYQTALALAPSPPAALYEAMGDLHVLAGDYPAAIRSYETAAALISQANLSIIEHKLGNIHTLLGAWELAECHYQAALEGVQNPAQQAWTYADWSRSALRRGETGRAMELAGKSLELAQASQEVRSLMQAHNILGMVERNQGNLDAAVTHLEYSRQLAETSSDFNAQAAALNNLALIQSTRGDFSAAILLAQQALELCQRQGDLHRATALHNNLADFSHAQGNQEAAMQHLKQAATLFSEIEVDDLELKPEIWKLTEW